MRSYIFDLRSRHARQSHKAGGKSLGLARLRHLGFDVPNGFVIGASVFDDMIRSLGIQDTLTHPLQSPNALNHLRRTLSEGFVRLGWRKQIVSAYRKLGGRVAVRSSMIGEDGARTSLAGQLEIRRRRRQGQTPKGGAGLEQGELLVAQVPPERGVLRQHGGAEPFAGVLE